MKMVRRSTLILVFLICSSFSERSYAASEAQQLAKMVGSLTGMANVCGHTVSKDWLAASIKAINDVSKTSGDFRAAQKLRDKSARAASAQQRSQPQLNCADVLRFVGDLEPIMPEAAVSEAQVVAMPPAQTSGMAGPGNYSIWLISMKSEAKAASYLDKAKNEHPRLLGEGKGAVVPVDFGKGRIYYRVVAGGFTERGAAEARCTHMRSVHPGEFCKVLSN